MVVHGLGPPSFHPPDKQASVTGGSSRVSSPSKHTWASVEELQELLHRLGLNLQLVQLERGALGGKLLTIELPPLRLVQSKLDRRLHSLGPKPREMLTLSLELEPATSEGLIHSHGQALPEDSLFGADLNREVHLTLPAEVNLAMVFLPLQALQQWGEQLAWPGFDGELLPPANVLAMNQPSSSGLRRFLLQLFALADRSPERMRCSTTRLAILEDLMPLLLEAMVSGPTQSIRPPARIGLVKEVQQWMHDYPTKPITLAGLCRQVHTSRRTLIQGFHDHLGMGPMAYLKLFRLHGIRHRLLRADPDSIQIGAIAGEWGFHNAGHFAADYYRLFGERPRDTLRRRGH